MHVYFPGRMRSYHRTDNFGVHQPAKIDIKTAITNHKIPRLKMDSRDFGIGAQILHDLSIRKLRVITNSKQKPRVGITGYGLEIVDYVKF